MGEFKVLLMDVDKSSLVQSSSHGVERVKGATSLSAAVQRHLAPSAHVR